MHRGGGNARITSHNQGFSLIKAFNNLALWGEKKFVSELKRTYKFQRGVNNRLDCHANQTRILSKEFSFVAGDYVRSTARNDVNCHTEDNSPKYRMVGEILSILRSFAVQTRIFAKECNIIAVGYVRSTAQDDENLNRLRNKCAMTCDLFPRPFGERVRERGYLAASLLSRLAAFTLAEVLITLGIIGVVAALTIPTLMANYRKSVVEKKIYTTYNILQNTVRMSAVDNGDPLFWNLDNWNSDIFEQYFAPYLNIVKRCKTTNFEEDDCDTIVYNINGNSSVTYSYKYILSNGVGIMFRPGGTIGTTGRRGTFLIDTMSGKTRVVGKNVFPFNLVVYDDKYYVTSKSDYMKSDDFCKDNKNTLIRVCKSGVWGNRGTAFGIGCTALIECNNWQIPKDYPVKF